MWSIGVILYIMLAGKPPFYGRTDREILQKVTNGSYDLNSDLWKKRSNDVKDLIRGLMERDVTKRMTAAQALQHKWIQRKVHSEFDVELAKVTLGNLQDFRVRISDNNFTRFRRRKN